MNAKRRLTAVLALTAVFTLASCGDASWEWTQDAPIGAREADVAADLVNFPDGYANVATKCNNGNRVYVTTSNNSSKAIAVVPGDPSCQK